MSAYIQQTDNKAGDASLTSFRGHGILGDCVASTMRSRLYFTPTNVRFPSELGRLRDILGDCVASTMPSHLYFAPTNIRYPSELGRLRDTLQSREKILVFTRIRTRELRLGHRAP